MSSINKRIVLIAIGVLVVVLLILTLISIFLPKSATKRSSTPAPSAIKNSNLRAFTTIAAQMKKQEYAVGEAVPIDIIITTGSNAVTGVQLEMEYDPTLIAVDTITEGTFFAKPIVIANKNDKTKGQIVFAVGSFDGKTGNGAVATLTARALKKTNGRVEGLTVKPTSLVTELNNKTSVLRAVKGVYIVIR